jgi:hypothetical protein
VSGSPDITSETRPSDYEVWRRLCLFYATIVALPVVMLAVWVYVTLYVTAFSDGTWPSYAVLAVPAVGYTAMATRWGIDARREGAPWSQWLFGAVAVAMFVLVAGSLTLVIFVASHWDGGLP